MKSSARRNTRRPLPGYQSLEARRLLAADLPAAAPVPNTYLNSTPAQSYSHAIVGNYRRDFADVLSGSNEQWQYLWNAPDDWSTNNNGDQDTNPVGVTNTYMPLSVNDRVFRPTGTQVPNAASGHLFLTNRGGHTGIHAGLSTTNAHDRYAVTAFEVANAGYFSIQDSFLTKNRPGGDAIEVVVHLDDGRILNRMTTQAGADYRIEFDTNLGFLEAGETIYVGVGAEGDHLQDRFIWNFSIARYEGSVAGHFSSDFFDGKGDGGAWGLLWNSPEGFPDSNDDSRGLIGRSDEYHPLVFNGSTATPGYGATNFGDVAELYFDQQPDDQQPNRQSIVSGHPGSAGMATNSDRYAIVAFTVDSSGYYSITDSILRATGTFGNGIEILVHNESGETTHHDLIAVQQNHSFDHSLGFMNAGESLYVAIGADGNDLDDHFEIDFRVVSEPMVRPAPLRDIQTSITVRVNDYGAIPDDSIDDHVAIQQAIDDATIIQRIYRVPVGIELSRGVYRLGKIDSTNLWIQHARDLKFYGAGAGETRLLLTNPRSALMRITDSEDILVSGFDIDYETLPFTQGTVVRVVDNHQAVLSVDHGYVPPDDPVLFAEGLTTHRTQFVEASRTGRLVDGSDFYKSLPEETTLNANGTYSVTYQHELPSSLQAGDGWYQIARINERSTFGLSRNRGHVSFVGIDSYAATSGFVQGQYNELVDVIDNRVLFTDGRLVSMAGDAVHIQRSTYGPWVEGNRFFGPSDDIAHVYRFPDTDLGRQLSQDSFEILNRKDLQAGDKVAFFRDDGYRNEARIVTRRQGVVTFDQPIEGYTEDTTIIPLGFSSRGSVFRDNVFALHRAGRGSLVTFSPDTTVLGNRFRAINSHAIGTSGYNDFTISDGLVVQGNLFKDVGFKDNLLPIDVGENIKNLKIVDNVFENVVAHQETDATGALNEQGCSNSRNSALAPCLPDQPA